MTRRERLARAAVACGLTVLLLGVLVLGLVRWTDRTPAPAPRQDVPCVEDQPCWDCATMGNQVCGPVVP